MHMNGKPVRYFGSFASTLHIAYRSEMSGCMGTYMHCTNIYRHVVQLNQTFSIFSNFRFIYLSERYNSLLEHVHPVFAGRNSRNGLYRAQPGNPRFICILFNQHIYQGLVIDWCSAQHVRFPHLSDRGQGLMSERHV